MVRVDELHTLRKQPRAVLFPIFMDVVYILAFTYIAYVTSG